MAGKPVLEVRDLSVLYGDIMAVSAASIALQAGRVVGLAGESGAGKTTLAFALAGYLAPGAVLQAGSVWFDGHDLLAAPADVLRRVWGAGIGFMPQDSSTALNPARRVGAQLREVMRSHLCLSRARARDHSLDLLAQVGVAAPATALRRYPHELSGGEQQRVALALAICCRPRVLILDEPTSSLDGKTRLRIVRLIESLTRELGAATLLVSHDLPMLARVSDELAVMSGGAIVEHGPALRVFNVPRHPHTRSLIEAIPSLPREASSRLRLADGPEPAALLTVHDLRCIYRNDREDHVALDRVSLELLPGQTLGVTGESGAGKTTLLRAVAGLVRPADGEILLRGEGLDVDVRSRSRAQRRAIQIVFQNPDATLNPRHTVFGALTRPLKLFRSDIARTARRAAAAEILERVRLPAVMLDRFPAELSGGERQRVAIARALAARPEVLLCDEITSGLDTTVQCAVLDLLRDLAERESLALVLVSHDLGVLGAVADRALVLEAGSVREEGPIRDVLLHPRHPHTVELIRSLDVTIR